MNHRFIQPLRRVADAPWPGDHDMQPELRLGEMSPIRWLASEIALLKILAGMEPRQGLSGRFVDGAIHV